MNREETLNELKKGLSEILGEDLSLDRSLSAFFTLALTFALSIMETKKIPNIKEDEVNIATKIAMQLIIASFYFTATNNEQKNKMAKELNPSINIPVMFIDHIGNA